MKIFAHYRSDVEAFGIVALEGDNKGQVIATAEQLILSSLLLNVSALGCKPDAEVVGAIGDVEALWGTVIFPQVSNRTLRDLRIGAPWCYFAGQFVRYDGPVISAQRARLSADGAVVDGVTEQERACPIGSS